MLLNLSINDLAIVKTLDLDLENGMSVLTGETGAGKSILLTALGLALGDRADSGYVRPESKRAEINLEFGLKDAPAALQWLQDNDLDEEQSCLIRRTITQDGRSKAYINNRPVTLMFLQRLGEKLVEIHGQHAHLTLLKSEQQQALLDQYGHHQETVATINNIYRQWHKSNQELQSLLKSNNDQEQRQELLSFQIQELQQLDLENFDYPSLSDEHAKQANLGQILTIGQMQLDLLYDNEQQSVNQMLGQSLNELSALAEFTPDLNELTTLLTEAQIQIQESAQQLRRYLDAQEIDPQRLRELEQQISAIQSLSRKHQVNPDQLPQLYEQLSEELDGIAHGSERIEALESEVQQLRQQYFELAGQLHAKRLQTAKKLSGQISAMIKELGMPQGEFLIQVEQQPDSSPSLNGQDRIEFLVSANPGLPPKPLVKVASGGELSRISLAIMVATSNDKTTPTLIFDEVDSGIGGGVAEIVGKRLRKLGHNRQVLCVTHLPQVASQAHQHLYVSKSNEQQITSSKVSLLDEPQRIEEIARMLGGVEMTDNTLAHAKEMLLSGKA